MRPYGLLFVLLACLIAGGQAAQAAVSRETAPTASPPATGFIGAGLAQLTPDVRKQLNYQGPEGAVVTSVLPGYPADKADLHPGDVITSANGNLVRSPLDLTSIISATPVGASLTLDVWSGSSHRVVVVSVVERSQAYAPQVVATRFGISQNSPQSTAAPMTPPAPPSAAASSQPTTTNALFVVVPPVQTDYRGLVSAKGKDKTNDIRLHQLLSELQKARGSIAIHERIAALAGKLNLKPGVPESARRYFVQADYLQKTAKTSADYDLVIEDYERAVSSAPWWADAYYGLGTALEATQQYSNALECLKLSLLANPHGARARAIQNEVYIVQAREQKAALDQAAATQAAVAEATAAAEAAAAQATAAAKAAAAQAAAAEAATAAKRARYEHTWECHSTTCSSLKVSFSENGPFDAYITVPPTGSKEAIVGTVELHGTMNGNSISGEALVPGGRYDPDTGCTTPKGAQSTFTGTDSEDGLTLTLTVMLPTYHAQGQRGGIIYNALFGPVCTSITQSGSDPAVIVLTAQ